MAELSIIECTSPAELFRQYNDQSQPQPAYIELDLVDGTLLADYNSEIGNGRPPSVAYGLDRRYGIPLLTAAAANRVMREIAPLARRILADSETAWDGNNTVARLGEDARAAEEEIERLFDQSHPCWQNPFSDDDLVAVWDIDGAVNGGEADEFEITAATTDERLAEIEREILAGLATSNGGSVAVCPGLDDYLRELRDTMVANRDYHDYRTSLAAAEQRIEHANRERSAGADDRARAIADEVAARGRGGANELAVELGVSKAAISQAVARARAIGEPRRALPHDTLDRLLAAELRDIAPLPAAHRDALTWIVRGTVIDVSWIEQPGTLLSHEVEDLDEVHIPDRAALAAVCKSWTRAQALAVIDACLTGNTAALPQTTGTDGAGK